MNHTHFPKEVLLPDWARRDKSCKGRSCTLEPIEIFWASLKIMCAKFYGSVDVWNWDIWYNFVLLRASFKLLEVLNWIQLYFQQFTALSALHLNKSVPKFIVLRQQKYKTLFYFLETQHVSGINMSIFRSSRPCYWTTTLAVSFLICCVLE